jgi:hypothetical protein
MQQAAPAEVKLELMLLMVAHYNLHLPGCLQECWYVCLSVRLLLLPAAAAPFSPWSH